MNTAKLYKKATGLVIIAALLFAWSDAACAALAYNSPQEAAKALADATKAGDVWELSKILGPGSEKLIESGDEVADSNDRENFSAAYDKKNGLIPLGSKRERYILEIGEDDWQFPMPIVKDKKSGRWHFDSKAGAIELLDRRIGHNELAAMRVCLAYVEAQKEYRTMNPDNSKTPHFAEKITSSIGKRDGLYWDTKPEESPSPLGALAAYPEVHGYSPRQDGGTPFYGYRYRVLHGQGKNAPGGVCSYIENGLMTGGFALLAYPAEYGTSGIMSFIVGPDGVVYEKNLGKGTAALAAGINIFDPDKTWNKADVQAAP